MSGFHYFQDCADVDSAKARFRELAHTLHPDKGGDAAAFRDLVEGFQEYQRHAWNNAGRAKWGADFKERGAGSYDLTQEAMDVLRQVLRWPGIETEIIGTWIWCRGETRPYAEQFKGLGFRWAPKKTAWCFHTEPYKKRHRGTMSWEEMRRRYGSQSATSDPDEALSA